jgi:hypothetical protein
MLNVDNVATNKKRKKKIFTFFKDIYGIEHEL